MNEATVRLETTEPLKIRRRRFLEVAAALVGAVTVEAVFGQKLARAQEFPPSEPGVKITVTDPAFEALPNEAEITRTQVFGDITVHFDAADIPVKYDIAGEEWIFTNGERRYLIDQKELASQTTETEIGYQTMVMPSVEPQKAGVQSSEYSEAPSNILNYDQLQELGITILNNSEEKGAPQLFLRTSIVEEGILEPLAVFNSTGDSKSWLQIVPFAGSAIAGIHLPEGIAYDEHRFKVLHRADNAPVYFNEKLRELQEDVHRQQAKLHHSNVSASEQQDIRNDLLQLKIQTAMYSGTLPASLMTDEAIMVETGTLGEYISPYREDEGTHRGLTACIYFANPTADQLAPKRIVSFCFEPDGTVTLTNTEYKPASSGNPRPNIVESHPSPDDFPAYETPGDYLYGPNGIGFVIIHELAHFITMDVLPQMMKDHTIYQSKMYIEYIVFHPEIKELFDELVAIYDQEESDSDRTRRVQENLAELLAKSYFTRAHEQYLATGNDSLYGIAFKIPQTSTNPAGWQITNTPTSAV